MSMVASAKRWTVEEVLLLPDDGNRYEVVDGELLVTPSPGVRHEAASVELFHRLDAYVRREHIGTLFDSARVESCGLQWPFSIDLVDYFSQLPRG